MQTLYNEENSTFQGKMIVFTAPSGAGKTTLVHHLLKVCDNLDFSVSATTREKREYEVDGKDYYFITKEEFEKKIADDEFIEWEEVYEGQFYGTLKSEINRLWGNKKQIIFDIDVVGAQDIKNVYKEKCLTVFVKPPSFNVLYNRLKNRKTESVKSFNARIRKVKRELTFESRFDRVIVNDLLDVSKKEAEVITESFMGMVICNNRLMEE